mmetsp:Transcript_1437/g.1934  ORF Transcript_1437/g.1934 Transcript_1437/m.1934 type:complete len:568 (+) Transcript_1437:110-1813(+)
MSDNATTDDDDLREAAYLRLRFQDVTNVSSIWKYLQKAKWTYHQGQYRAPDGDSSDMLNSMDVLKKLDETAIPMITSYLEFPQKMQLEEEEETASPASSSSKRHTSHELRKQIIDQFKDVTLEKYSDIQIDEKECLDDNDEYDDKSRSRTNGKKRATRKSEDATTNQRPARTTSKKRSTASMVSADAGADLYTNPPPKRPKKSSRRGGTSDEINNKEFPSPQQVAEMFWNSPTNTVEMKKFYKLFSEWKFLLSTNHSLLFYGFGSKRNLINTFAEETLDSVGDVLTIDAFDKEVTMERLLDLIVTIFLNNEEPQPAYSSPAKSITNIGIYPSIPLLSENLNLTRAIAISQAIAKLQIKRKRPLYLVIHNIDSFRDRSVQDALAALLIHSSVAPENIRTIRLVASIDHINASTQLWDPQVSSNFSFIWQPVHTFEPPLHELKRGRMEKIKGRTTSTAANNKGGLLTGSSTPESVQDVLYTIAPRHTEVLQVLVKLQTKQKKGDVKFQKLLQECQNQCIVFADSQLRHYLTELLDHGLVEKRHETGTEYLKVPHDDASCLNVIMNFNKS